MKVIGVFWIEGGGRKRRRIWEEEALGIVELDVFEDLTLFWDVLGLVVCRFWTFGGSRFQEVLIFRKSWKEAAKDKEKDSGSRRRPRGNW